MHGNGLRVSSTGGCRGEASRPNPPTSPPKVLTIIIIQCLCVYNSSNDKIMALKFLCISQKWAYGMSKTFHALQFAHNQSSHTIFPPNKKS